MSGKIDPKLFSHSGQAASQESCPQCDHELVIRHGKRGPFLGCSQYPECDYIKPLHQNDGHIIKELGVPCSECGHELVLRQGRYGMFIGCSHYPECHHIESLDGDDSGTEPKVELTCPECGDGHLIERKNRFGKMFYACSGYPKCKFAVNLPPIKGTCQACGFGLLVEKKTAAGIKHQCANRQCGHYQTNDGDSLE
ncbi:type I DNA topoisomerase [Vibrio palustris]|uniref:DNA topoisomerase 1 n=1 Tax=Vibrio palustris TaxID=1918946 RepID=A0A1R4B7C3_9VIBR|nr:type I DNA topoisomerase [Vibrio palustris]SJL84815.1 DNA topoisomerase 1 [Vibrio palustris]